MKYKIVILFFLIAVLALGYLRGECSKAVEEPELPIEEKVVEILPFQHIFERYAPNIGWDWELLAALCYEESHFNPNAGSGQGARGLMQLMPRTARRFGLNDSTILIPEHAIEAGVKYISFLQKRFSYIKNPTEQQKFVIASYNAGPAHILDARRLAEKNGYNPYVWTEQTEFWVEQLQYDSIANDSLVQYGVFHNPYETTGHVHKVLQRYKRYKRLTNPFSEHK